LLVLLRAILNEIYTNGQQKIPCVGTVENRGKKW